LRRRCLPYPPLTLKRGERSCFFESDIFPTPSSLRRKGRTKEEVSTVSSSSQRDGEDLGRISKKGRERVFGRNIFPRKEEGLRRRSPFFPQGEGALSSPF